MQFHTIEISQVPFMDKHTVIGVDIITVEEVAPQLVDRIPLPPRWSSSSCNQILQRARKAWWQSCLKVSLVRTDTLLEPTTGS